MSAATGVNPGCVGMIVVEVKVVVELNARTVVNVDTDETMEETVKVVVVVSVSVS